MKAKLLVLLTALAIPAGAAVSASDIFLNPHRAASVRGHNATEEILWWVGVFAALDEANVLLEASPKPPFSFRLRAAYNRNLAEVVGGVGGRDNFGAYMQFMGRADLFEMFADYIGEPALSGMSGG